LFPPYFKLHLLKLATVDIIDSHIKSSSKSRTAEVLISEHFNKVRDKVGRYFGIIAIFLLSDYRIEGRNMRD
jgi:hypothetical protein